MKTCTKCQEERPLSEYYKDATCKGGYSTVCKPCQQARRRERYATDFSGQRTRELSKVRTEQDSANQFEWRLKRSFNMSLDQYWDMYEAQGGVCALCKKPESRVHHTTGYAQRLSVDHDHACCPTTPACGNCNRGLLCYECNLLLGKIERTPGLEQAIVSYLSR